MQDVIDKFHELLTEDERNNVKIYQQKHNLRTTYKIKTGTTLALQGMSHMFGFLENKVCTEGFTVSDISSDVHSGLTSFFFFFVYSDIVEHQRVGNGVPVFKGYPNQRGHGLGGILAGLARSALPILKKGAKELGKQVLYTGTEIVNDALQGKHIKTAAKRRLGQAGQRMAERVIEGNRSRTKPLKRKAPKKNVRTQRAKRAKRSQDIFDV
ncbi:hypothetical protein HOLleu_43078 [Holothuria leucospilota]|uniref:Uncharacterized protein n=1 Tax=Holothuria leucospilota TaxID=206669 RepID=A0A9Q1B9U7_HOLLE|nr:hypothetical protein HOLleu_43078 [Holothuria leucospilota]